jgi:peptidoglycan/xylan/chitin deacetylase (PgdA/CDA1 family)
LAWATLKDQQREALGVLSRSRGHGDAFGTSVGRIVTHTLAHTRAGSIVVMHITGGDTAPLTARALPAIVAGLRARGLRLVRLSTLLAEGAA